MKKEILLILAIMTILMGARGWRRRRRSAPPSCSPRNCQVGSWTSWSSCSHRCGSSGTRVRTRAIVQGASCGGSCPFHVQEKQACNRNNCQHGGTPHSSGCSCRAGYSGTCCERDIDECSLSNNGGCSHKCVNTFGGYKCECPDPGLRLSSDNKKCQAVKCPSITASGLVKISPDSCVTSQMNFNSNCSFSCPQGYQLQGPSYKQCGAGGQWSDSAKSVSCIDIDECSLPNNNGCSHKCVNTVGGYKCECPDPGLRLSSDNKTCQVVKCLSLTVSGLIKTSPDSCVKSQMNFNSNCSFSCPQGYQLQGPSYKQCGVGGQWSDSAMNVSCIDIDECSLSNNGGCSHKCVNTIGDYKCECPDPGLRLSSDNKTCQIVKCPSLTVSGLVKTSPDSCVTSQMNFNSNCSFSCPQGYQLQGPSYKQCGVGGQWSDSAKNVSCIDIDECSLSNNGGCSHKCVNTVGDYKCECPDPGLKLSSDNKTCQVVMCPSVTVSDLVKTSPDGCLISQMKFNSNCSFSCPQGYQLQGPSYKQCGEGGQWSDNAKNVSCSDIDECSVSNNVGCSHKCVNTVGGYKCECPDPELSLSSDNKTCHAPGVDVQCNRNSFTIMIPKSLLRGIDHEHLRLLDATCKASETSAYFSLTTPLTGCNTTSRHTPTAIVYSNAVLEIPVAAEDVVTRVREIEIQFSCLYSKYGLVSSFGWKPSNRKLVFSDEGKGNFTLSLNMFPDKRFVSPYMKDDFPVAVSLRERLFFEVSVTSDDKHLSIITDRCYATPTQNKKNSLKYEFITNGCPNDATVKFLSAPSVSGQRFSLEAFKFIADHPFVFVHCHVIICNATDPGSKCAEKCSSSGRGRREVSDHMTDDVYMLAQGPLHLALEKREQKSDSDVDKSASSPSLMMALFLMCVACLAGTALIVLKKSCDKPGYTVLATGDQE